MVAHWLLVSVDHGSNSSGGEKFFLFCFWVVISWLTLKLIHDYAKWLIHELIIHVWIIIRLNNLIAIHKTNEQKNYNKLKASIIETASQRMTVNWTEQVDHNRKGLCSTLEFGGLNRQFGHHKKQTKTHEKIPRWWGL